ncbi:MAG: cytochrome c biogenesis protein CcdA [Anaerolineales bacterium]|nr:cytochrome c biogenesis protein CcdA [Anaerolineales bacterium]
MDLANMSIGLAFLAGLASFLSPCVFSLVPAYVGYLGGRSAAAAEKGQSSRWLTLAHGVAFVLGFSFIFISVGLATSTLGSLLGPKTLAISGITKVIFPFDQFLIPYEGYVIFDPRSFLAFIGGLVVVFFGIHMTGLFRFAFLEVDLRPQSMPDRKRGYISSFLMGIFFSAGWSPCVGPILGSILTMALIGGSVFQGLVLLTAYSAGLAIPFLIASTQIGLVTTVIRRYGKVMRYVEIVMGVILIIVGMLLLSGQYAKLANASAGLFGIYDELALGRILFIAVVAFAVLGLIPAYIAQRKGRNFFDWWFFGVGLFPVALVMALRLNDGEKGMQ